MPVAKSYEKMELSGEPFKENGRMYINVRAPKGLKKVRWYSDAEYQRMYPDVAATKDIMDFNAYHAFGFDDTNFITLYKGRNVEEWANEDRTNIYYNCTFGFYTPGRLDSPHLIEGIEPIKLMWDEVKVNDTKMQPHEEVSQYVNGLLRMDTCGTSQYQGTPDEWIQKSVKVRSKKTKDGRYGEKHTYALVDAEGNTYIWETGAKNYACDQDVSLKMKVKEHKKIDNEKVTVVWYCKEI